MSIYTTELRYICETSAGKEKSSPSYSDIAEIIEKARPKIFSFPYPIFDSAYKKTLETKILKHFYTREIGLETVGLWKLKLDAKMNEIMPYYNKLYSSELLEINPLYTKDITISHTGASNTDRGNVVTGEQTNVKTNVEEFDNQTTVTKDLTNNTTKAETERQTTANTDTLARTETGTGHSETTNDNTNRDLYSDTPQGALTNVENSTYLTNARKVTDNGETETSSTGSTTISSTDTLNGTVNNEVSGTTTNTNTGTETTRNTGETNGRVQDTNNKQENTTETIANTDEYLQRITGFEGTDGSELILKYRKTFLNIDLMVIGELEELFLQLW